MVESRGGLYIHQRVMHENVLKVKKFVEMLVLIRQTNIITRIITKLLSCLKTITKKM